MIGNFGIAFAIWLLLTGDVSVANLGIGIGAALLVSRVAGLPTTIDEHLLFALRTAWTLPFGFAEAVYVLVWPHFAESIRMEEPRQTKHPQSTFTRFARVFLCTLTPRTIALHVDESGRMFVHHIAPGKRK